MSIWRRIWWAIKLPFIVLFSRTRAERIAAALSGESVSGATRDRPTPKPKQPPAPPPPKRSEALTLLATLQRESRLVDFLREPLEGYSDAQIGAAARDVHRDAAAVMDRLFALEPVVDEPEGAEVDVPAGFDAGRFRLVGNVTGEPPHHGRLAHHGWQATRVNLPTWTGSDESAHVVAPAEVEL